MEVKFIKAGCGDAIAIHYRGDDGKYHNILIDGGTEKGNIYLETLKPEIEEIYQRNECIDLWVITHIDDDHIGGILRFIKDEASRISIDLSTIHFWFNYSKIDYDTGLKSTKLVSIGQGIRLRDFLSEHSKLNEEITASQIPVNLFGLKIYIVSPDAQKFKAVVEKWTKEEIKIRSKEIAQLKARRPCDYGTKIEDFDLSKFSEDTSTENGSSIALLFEMDGKKFLQLADSHPSVVIDSLKKLGYSEANKLILDYMQIAHHGSRHNTCDELLQMIQCSDFIVSADGINKDNLPHKETLVRFIKEFPNSKINFYLTHKNSRTESIFNIDKVQKNVSLEFPSGAENALKFNL